jgi:hypothetical protein
VVVVPEINAGTASLVATVINPVIGLGSFLAQMILRNPLIRAATQEFHIDGTWADPRVTPVPRKPAADNRAEFQGDDHESRCDPDGLGHVAARPTWPPPMRCCARRRGQGAELAVLPEYFCLMGHKDTDKLAVREPPMAVAPCRRFWPALRASWACGWWAAPCPWWPVMPSMCATPPGVFTRGRLRGALRQDPPVPL